MQLFIEFIDRHGRRFIVHRRSIVLLRELGTCTHVTFALGPNLRRRIVAEPIDSVGQRLDVERSPQRQKPVTETEPEYLPPAGRKQRVLHLMLLGKSEKEIAAELSISAHTVHVYVKQLYRRYQVESRGELLARFVRPSVLTKLSESFGAAATRLVSRFLGRSRYSKADIAAAKDLTKH